MANRRPDRLARRSFFLSSPSPSSHRRLTASPLPRLAYAASHLTTPRHASPRLATPRHASPRRVTPRLVTPCLATPRHIRYDYLSDIIFGEGKKRKSSRSVGEAATVGVPSVRTWCLRCGVLILTRRVGFSGGGTTPGSCRHPWFDSERDRILIAVTDPSVWASERAKRRQRARGSARDRAKGRQLPTRNGMTCAASPRAAHPPCTH